jgi:hypothetical protein
MVFTIFVTSSFVKNAGFSLEFIHVNSEIIALKMVITISNILQERTFE